MNKTTFATITNLLVLMLVVTGCANQNRSAQPEVRKIAVKKIAILPIKEPRDLALGKRGGPLAFLPGGRAWSKLEMSGKSSQFARGMRELNLKLGRDITNALRDNLEKHGFEVVILTDNLVRANPDDPEDMRYDKIKTDADAILNVWVTEAGAFSLFSSLVYQPQLNLEVRLVPRALPEEVLYALSITYGADSGKADNDSVPSDAKYAFKDYDAIMANLPQVAESLNVGAQAMANQIANQIRREIKQAERTD